MSFREIVDKGDDREAETHEQVTFYGMLWGVREVTYADVSTEIFSLPNGLQMWFFHRC